MLSSSGSILWGRESRRRLARAVPRSTPGSLGSPWLQKPFPDLNTKTHKHTRGMSSSGYPSKQTLLSKTDGWNGVSLCVCVFFYQGLYSWKPKEAWGKLDRFHRSWENGAVSERTGFRVGSFYWPPSKELLKTVVQFAVSVSLDSEGMVCVHAKPSSLPASHALSSCSVLVSRLEAYMWCGDEVTINR